MGQYTSYYLYQRYEQREGQDPIPCTPNVYSVDGYGTMEKVIKMENDPDCGYEPPTPSEPIYRWYQIPITEDYICNDCGDTPTPTPTGDSKLFFTTSNAEYQINCSSSSALTMNEISAYTYDASCCCFRDMRTAVIGNCVTSIGKDAFHPYRKISEGYMYYNYPSLSSVTMSDNVISIGESAFESCYGLTSIGVKNSNASIKIPYSVTSIGEEAFQFCTGLTSVTLSSYITNISDRTFRDCHNLESINMPDVETIGEAAFANCHSLTSISLPSTLKTIKDSAFAYCGLINLTIPNSVSGIGATYDCTYGRAGAFAHNSGLTNVTIGSGVTLIGEYTFNDTPSLTTVTMNSTTPPSGGCWMFGDENINPNLKIYVPCGTLQAYKEAPYWSSYAQYIYAQGGCPPEANKLEITYTDSSTLTIECGASSAVTSSDTIANRDSIEKVVIGECATSISANAFRYCTALTSVTISDSVTSIGASAFTNTSLQNVVFGESITTISQFAFRGCSGMTMDVVLPSIVNIEQGAFAGTNINSIELGSSIVGVNGGNSTPFGSSLTQAIIHATTPPIISVGMIRPFEGSYPIYVPAEAVDTYKNDSYWSRYASRIQAIP